MQKFRFSPEGTIIFIADKKNNQIIKTIKTEGLGIRSVCGLCSIGPGKIIGIDRNSKNLFYIEFDDSLNVVYNSIKQVPVSIPGFNNLGYIASLESVAIDDSKNVYLIDDPWKRFYVPDAETLKKLDGNTISNFKEFIPIIYKFNFNLKK